MGIQLPNKVGGALCPSDDQYTAQVLAGLSPKDQVFPQGPTADEQAYDAKRQGHCHVASSGIELENIGEDGYSTEQPQ
jgi:hypothetical protein